MSTQIGTKIKRIREEKNYTQEYMAEKLKISQNSYSKIETGGVKVTTDRLKEIAKVLNVPVEKLISDESQVFNLNNNTIEKFYGYIENLQEGNKDLMKSMEDQLKYLQDENGRLLKTIESLVQKLK